MGFLSNEDTGDRVNYFNVNGEMIKVYNTFTMRLI